MTAHWLRCWRADHDRSTRACHWRPFVGGGLVHVGSDMRSREAPLAPVYPAGTVEALLHTDLVTAQTRRVLEERLHAPAQHVPRFFDADHYATLRAVCHLLIPQPDRPEPIDLAAAVDDRLARNDGKGWRYASMPPDREAYPLGLRGIEESAQSMLGVAFVALDEDRQHQLLRAVQSGSASGGMWSRVPPALFFEELLAELVESYYSHPSAQEEIGYVGFADAHGWQQIGLDQPESHEPRPV
jgi:gluconate 2-dehydrogenase gamma chain